MRFKVRIRKYPFWDSFILLWDCLNHIPIFQPPEQHSPFSSPSPHDRPTSIYLNPPTMFLFMSSYRFELKTKSKANLSLGISTSKIHFETILDGQICCWWGLKDLYLNEMEGKKGFWNERAPSCPWWNYCKLFRIFVDFSWCKKGSSINWNQLSSGANLITTAQWSVRTWLGPTQPRARLEWTETSLR